MGLIDDLAARGWVDGIPQDSYEGYLHSSEWEAKREQRLIKDNYCCRTCGDSKAQAKSRGSWLEVHHVYNGCPYYGYPKPLGSEEMDNLITLCNECHESITKSVRIRRNKASKRKPSTRKSSTRKTTKRKVRSAK